MGVNLNDITQLPGGNYLAFGDFGTVMISTDGGTTWESSYVDTQTETETFTKLCLSAQQPV